jgi:hypothetical protein
MAGGGIRFLGNALGFWVCYWGLLFEAADLG